MHLKIFIGSSREGLEVAQKVKELMPPELNATLWNEAIYSSGQSVINILQHSIHYYDFGIFVATADDLIDYRNEMHFAIRDNVLFEFGLFFGAKGYDSAFLICDEKAKLPSDLNGVVVERFNPNAATNERLGLENAVRNICRQVAEQQHKVALSKMPSGILAYDYYINYVTPLAVYLRDNVKEFGLGAALSRIKLNILISDSLNDHTQQASETYFNNGKWKDIPCNTKTNTFHIYRKLTTSEKDFEFHIIPHSLSALEIAVIMLFPQSHFGKSAQRNEVVLREIQNFTRVLKHFIENDLLCNKIVHVNPMHP